MVACVVGGHQRFAEARVAGATAGQISVAVVLSGLQAKAGCGKGSIFAVLNFATFFQEKVVGRCGYEQTANHNAHLPAYGIATLSLAMTIFLTSFHLQIPAGIPKLRMNKM
jgi:hypothetical protein